MFGFTLGVPNILVAQNWEEGQFIKKSSGQMRFEAAIKNEVAIKQSVQRLQSVHIVQDSVNFVCFHQSSMLGVLDPD